MATLLQSLARSAAGPLRTLGVAFENAGHSLAGSTPASQRLEVEAARAAKNSALGGSAAFVAPSANVSVGAVRLGEQSSLWYNVVVDSDCTLGRGSQLREGTVVRGGQTAVGELVAVGPSAVLEGCTLNDHCVVGAGATIGSGATVESGAVVAPGAVVASGATVKAGELWSGSPAAFVRAVSDAETQAIAQDLVKLVALAETHKLECAKDPAQVADERQEFEDRDLYYETILEDREADWDTFVAMPGPGAQELDNAHRRGLIYDK